MLVMDVLSVLLAETIAFFVTDTAPFGREILLWMGANVALAVLFLFLAQGYAVVFSLTTLFDALKILLAVALQTALNIVFAAVTGQRVVSVSTVLVFGIFLMNFAVYSRFCKRLNETIGVFFRRGFKGKKRVMIVGGGETGLLIVKEQCTSKRASFRPVCILDDDKNKLGKHILNVKIVGDIASAPQMAKKYNVDEIFFAIPSASRRRQKEIINILKDCKKPVKILPGIFELTDGKVTVSKFRDVEITDLLGREQVQVDLTNSTYPEAPVVPFIKATQDRMVLEIQRGCIRGCRFCQAGMIYRPNREKKVDHLKDVAAALIKNTGHEEISLSSLSSSDYKELDELITFLLDICKEKKINISLPSLRIDAFSLDIMQKVQDVKKSSLTFAPEAGTQRLRNVINKGLTVDDIMNGSKQAFEGGWNKVKFYFMLGLPTETEEDMRGIPELANDVAALYYDTVPKEKRAGKCQITISTSFFVPKPFTPFQWARMYEPSEYLGRAKIVNDHVKEQLNRKSIRYNWHEAYVTVIEGILARGDRRICDAIVKVYEKGGYYDAWTEYFDYDRWIDSIKECGLDPDFYTMRERPLDEVFPWDFIDIGVTKQFMIREWETAHKETVTPNCRMRCSACGAKSYGGGVCYEN